ncbi:hypothetical protein NHX12_005353 [Muraenolepis orangiensis]|uniref:UBA domain-containing protein n=1 Tax=Muraenolepis orangiensis TaxID=630683 RepID=A0A9Q0DTT2_9TELE|nr:hypothetical protein NHX12_005353 [Muraenolepis orangiensis]
MSVLEGVPLKMPLCPIQDQYEFSLENWVLTGLDSECFRQPRPPVPHSLCASGALTPSCPPYWLLFSSPQQSRLASRYSSDFWEPNPRPRSNSLNLASLHPRPTLASSDWEDDGPVERDTGTPWPPSGTDLSAPAGTSLRQSGRKAQKAFKPSLLNPPACLSSLPHQRRKNLRQCSLSALETRSPLQENQKQGSPAHVTPPPPGTKPLSSATLRAPLRASASNIDGTPRSLYSTPLSASPLLSPDSWVELLSALSPEERELLRAITDRGYPLRTAFIALQKTGQQPPDQIFSYLGACDHLCDLGFDKAQVEEALEMFQNSETKAEEFLTLLHQFNEMGFQQSTIKEVLLVHDNHRERALEDLIMHVA